MLLAIKHVEIETTTVYYCTATRLAIISETKSNSDEDVERKKDLNPVGRNINQYCHFGK